MSTLVLGASGLVGSALTRLMSDQRRTFCAPNSSELDLTNRNQVEEYLTSENFSSIFFAAAKVGGVGANIQRPKEFLLRNLEMELNVLRTALELGIPNLIFISSSCVYPEFGRIPLEETSILTGKLSDSVKPYAVAKISAMEIVSLAKSEFGLHWISVIPSNVYGINDNFRISDSHVVASTIRKIHDARKKRTGSVEMWGRPDNERDLLYSDDLARAVLFIEENYFDDSLINVGPGIGTKIEDLCKILGKQMNYHGEFLWNNKMPSGTARKVLDNSRLRNLGFSNYTALESGLLKVLNWLGKEEENGFKEIRWH